ncbi:MAG: AGE family epimerase/isomerase [Candidatus Eremiobacterota bacterium]
MNINSINMKPVTTATTQKTASQEVSSDSISLGNTSPSGFMNNLNHLRQLSETGKIEGTSSVGSKEFWVNQATHMTDFFAKVSKDEVDGGFYTHIDSTGKVSNENEKFLMPTSRQIYSYAATYELTGDKKYLDMAKHGVDFVLSHHMNKTDNGEVFWTQRVDKKGNIPEGSSEDSLAINEQTYGLTGLIAYYKATKDPEILEVIKGGHKFLTEHFTDKEKGGFFDSVNSGTFEANKTKSYNSTVYPATSALLDMAEIAEGDWKKEVMGQLKELSGDFIKYFPDPSTGFIKENFTSDWNEDWRGWQKQPEGTIGVTGHNTQGALFLLRAERLLAKEGLLTDEESKAYKDSAKNILDSILEKGYDKQNGGWFDVFVRETGKNMWHTNKAFWQQEEGYLATLAMSKIDGDPKYKEATDKTLQFWDKYFMDREVGGDRQTVAQDGTALTDPKGGPGKSSYHSVEMAKLALEIGNW